MFIDLHMHERTCSSDSFLSLEMIVTIAKEKGLDAVCITDHDSMGLKECAARYSMETGFPILVGVEYYSLQGDIVAFGIEDIPDGRIDAQSFIDFVKSRGGICISAHPFRNNNRGLGEHLKLVRGLDAVEVLNGSTLPDANRKAYEYAMAFGFRTVGASDCHVQEKVGRYATYVPGCVTDVPGLILAMRAGGLRPAVYENGSYQIAPPSYFIRPKESFL